MMRPEKRRLERVRYWQGQRLRSSDFLDIERVEAQRRWWHNRALHQAYGVYEGFHVSASPLGIHSGVVVSPGVAYDVFGHELILERPQTVPLPANVQTKRASRVTLLARYSPPPRDIEAARYGDVCFTQTRSFTSGTAEFVWKLTRFVEPCEGVPIGELYSSNGKYSALGGAVRLITGFRPVKPQAVARPLLASGSTVPGNTAWAPWIYQNLEIGVQTTVDTSAAGFTRVPCYFAWLAGPVWNSQTMQLAPAIFPSIANESVGSFAFSLWLQFPTPTFELEIERRTTAGASATPPQPTFNFVTDPYQFVLFAQQQRLCVNWIGCQMPVPISRCGMQAASVAGANVDSAAPQIS
jgi:hypothetical protein